MVLQIYICFGKCGHCPNKPRMHSISSKGCDIWKTDQPRSVFCNSLHQLERVHSDSGKICRQESQQLKITSGSP